MGRLRARLAEHPVERDLLKNLAEAERSLQKALNVVRAGRKDKDLRTARLSDLENKIQSALRLISTPPSVVSKIDKQDPDLNESVRDKRRREREQRRNKRGNK